MGDGANSKLALNFGAPFSVALGIMLFSQPKQGETRGRLNIGGYMLIDLGEGHCLHIHHWIICFTLALALLLGTYASNGEVTPLVVLLLGALAGVAASDLAYTDLSLRRFCVSCPALTDVASWKGRAALACRKDERPPARAPGGRDTEPWWGA